MTGLYQKFSPHLLGFFILGEKEKFNLRILQKHQAKNYCLCTVHYLRAIFTINKNNKKIVPAPFSTSAFSTILFFSVILLQVPLRSSAQRYKLPTVSYSIQSASSQ